MKAPVPLGGVKVPDPSGGRTVGGVPVVRVDGCMTLGGHDTMIEGAVLIEVVAVVTKRDLEMSRADDR